MNGPTYPVSSFDRLIGLITGTSDTTNDYGEVTGQTETVKYMRARIVWKDNDETSITDKETVGNVKTVIIRHYDGIDYEWQVKIDDVNYDIINIEEVGRKKYHRLKVRRFE